MALVPGVPRTLGLIGLHAVIGEMDLGRHGGMAVRVHLQTGLAGQQVRGRAMLRGRVGRPAQPAQQLPASLPRLSTGVRRYPRYLAYKLLLPAQLW